MKGGNLMSKNVLLDLERTIATGLTTYWKPNKMGYTRELKEAGLYDDDVAKEIVQSDYDKRTVAINKQVIDNIL